MLKILKERYGNWDTTFTLKREILGGCKRMNNEESLKGVF